MNHADDRVIRAGVERRLSVVESLISATPAWRELSDHDVRSPVVRVVAGPALRRGRGGRRFGVLSALGAVIILVLAYGLFGAGGRPSVTPPEPTPTPIATTTAEPTTEVGALRPVVEPRLTIPIRPITPWTLVADQDDLLTLVYLLEDVGSIGYNVGLMVVEPHGVYDPVVESRRLDLPADLIGWIRDHPDLESDEPVARTVAGLSARAIDVTVIYSSAGPKGQTAQFIDIGPGPWNLEAPSKKRIILVDLPDRPLLIVFDSRPEFFDAAVERFEEEIALIRFEDRGPSP